MSLAPSVEKTDIRDPGLATLRSATGKTLSAGARVWRLASLERGDLTVVFIYAVVTGLISLIVPVAVQSVVNTVAFTALSQPLVVLSALVLIGLSLAGILNTIQYQVVETLNQRFFVRATRDAAHRLVHADLSKSPPNHSAELLNRFLDVALVQKATSTLLLDGLSIALQGCVALLLLAFYHPALLAFDALLVFFIAMILFVLGRNGTETSIKESKAKYAVVADLQELARAGSLFKSPAGAAFALERADNLARSYVYARKKHFRVVRRQVAASFALQALATASLLGLGGALVIDGQLTLGQLVAAEIAVTAVLSSVAKLGKYLENYYDLAAALDKVGQIVDLPEERASGSHRSGVTGPASLSLEQVSYSPTDGSSAFQPLSLDVTPGKLCAVFGKDASGKTILAEMLYGLRRPSSGQISIDGANLSALDLFHVRQDVVLIGTDPPFSGTLQDNLGLGNTTLDPTRVSQVLRLVGLNRDVSALPDGTSTVIGPGGSHLTGSQAARLGLARGILAQPRLLVLDGTLDRVEQSAALEILSSLRELQHSTTVLLLTADLELAQACDEFARLVTSRGEV